MSPAIGKCRAHHFSPFYSLWKNSSVYSWNHCTEDIELGVTIFNFEFPKSPEQFVKVVNEWMTSTKEGKRYLAEDSEGDTVLKIQRGKGIITAPIVLEFEVGAVLGLPTEMQVRGYVHPFGLKNYRQDLRSDAMSTAIPRRNGWKDMIKLLDYADISNYNHQFHQ